MSALKFEDIKIGDTLEFIRVCHANGKSYIVGEQTVVSDLSINGGKYVYIEGAYNTSGMGLNVANFKKVVEKTEMKKKKSFAELVGLVVGKKYKLIVATQGEPAGTIVTFEKDDNSPCPLFKLKDGEAVYFYVNNVEPLTPAEDAGLVIGKKYVVKSTNGVPSSFKIGDIVEYIRDDKFDAPRFKRVRDDKEEYISICDVKEHKPTPAEEKGLVISQKYEVIEDDGGYASKGMVLTYFKDDKTARPMFKGDKDYIYYPHVDKVTPYVDNRTPAQKAGLIVGKRYKVLKEYNSQPWYKAGDTIEFVRDDASSCPLFKQRNGQEFYIELHKIEEYVPVEVAHVSFDFKQVTFTKPLTQEQIKAIKALF